MTRAVLFWIIMILWIIALLGGHFWGWPVIGGTITLVVLLSLLGWQTFGPAIKG